MNYIISKQNSAKTSATQRDRKEENGVFKAIGIYLLKIKSNRLHAVSRTQQGRQGEPSVKTLRFSLSAKFWKHCVLSGGTQRRPLPRHQNEKMQI